MNASHTTTANAAMNDQDKAPTPLELLRGIVELCKRRGVVRIAAEAMELRPQAMYAWMSSASDGGPVLTARAARMRLLAISHLRQAELAEIADAARSAVGRLEAAEQQGVQS